MIIEGPGLHEVGFVGHGDGKGGHVAFIGGFGAGEAEEGEVELAIGGGGCGGLHGGLIAIEQ